MALGLHFGDFLFHVRHLGLEHLLGVQRNIRAGPCCRCRRKIVSIGFAVHLEDSDGQLLGKRFLVLEPFRIGPALHHFLRPDVALIGLLLHIVVGVVHQQRMTQRIDRFLSHRFVVAVQQFDQRLNVIATQHGAQQEGGPFRGDQRGTDIALGHVRQKSRLDVGSLVHTRRHAIFQQIDQKGLFTGRRVLDQLHQLRRLFGVQRQGRQSVLGALFHMLTVGFQK